MSINDCSSDLERTYIFSSYETAFYHVDCTPMPPVFSEEGQVVPQDLDLSVEVNWSGKIK